MLPHMYAVCGTACGHTLWNKTETIFPNYTHVNTGFRAIVQLKTLKCNFRKFFIALFKLLNSRRKKKINHISANFQFLVIAGLFYSQRQHKSISLFPFHQELIININAIVARYTNHFHSNRDRYSNAGVRIFTPACLHSYSTNMHMLLFGRWKFIFLPFSWSFCFVTLFS